MSTRRRHVPAPPEAVWEVLADGWDYPSFVVGAARMRQVDDGWPAPGTRLHHSVGVWPLLLQDTTVSVLAEPPRRLELTARGWPAGEARVVFEIEPDGTGSLVSVFEDATAGPGLLVPRPIRSVMADVRNGETLRRLADQARGRVQRSGGGLGGPAPLGGE